MRVFFLLGLIQFAGVLGSVAPLVSGQELGSDAIETANQFFHRMSESFQHIQDYRARFQLIQAGVLSEGELLYRQDEKLLLRFTEPKGRVVLLSEGMLHVYMPSYGIAFQQVLADRATELGLAGLAKGYAVLRQNYGIAYLTQKEPRYLDLEKQEGRVFTALQFHSYSSSEPLNRLHLYFSPSGMVRGVQAFLSRGGTLELELWDVELNVGLTDVQFRPEFPLSVNVEENLLYQP